MTAMTIIVPCAVPAITGRTEAQLWPNATVAAASASTADVQTAYNAVADGGIITIPDGSATWTAGLDTSANKKVLIRALNRTPANNQGRTTQSVVITGNASEPLFPFTSGETYHLGLSGIRFLQGTADYPHLTLSGAGSKIPLIFDCSMTWSDRFGSSTTNGAIVCLGQGGLFWDCRFDGLETLNSTGSNIVVTSTKSWEDNHTIGTADTSGLVNVYFEDCAFYKTGLMDIELNGRVVLRYCTYDGSWIETHGLSSPTGGRHYEVYNCDLSNTSQMDLSGRWSWLRAGVAIITDNVIDNSLSGYADPAMTCIVETGSATNGSYPYYKDIGTRCMQAGWGYESGAAYLLGAWYWNNTGPNGSEVGYDANAQSGRDIFLDSGAPSDQGTYGFDYAKYTYPHPLRSV